MLPDVAIVAAKHAQEGPLRPVVIRRLAGAHLAAPVEGEADLIQLFAIAIDVVHRRHLRVLTRLDGVLLGRQTVGVVTHRVEHVEAAEAFVASVDVGGDVAQRMAHMQPCTGRVGEHVEHVVFRACMVLVHLVGLVGDPAFTPFLFDFSEGIFHCVIRVVRSSYAPNGAVVRSSWKNTYLVRMAGLR